MLLGFSNKTTRLSAAQSFARQIGKRSPARIERSSRGAASLPSVRQYAATLTEARKVDRLLVPMSRAGLGALGATGTGIAMVDSLVSEVKGAVNELKVLLMFTAAAAGIAAMGTTFQIIRKR